GSPSTVIRHPTTLQIIPQRHIIQSPDPRIPDRIHIILIQHVCCPDLDGAMNSWNLHADLSVEGSESRRGPTHKGRFISITFLPAVSQIKPITFCDGIV